MKTSDIPRFFLYGEPPQVVGDRFLHLEALDVRLRPAHWNVRAHTHSGLCHIFNLAAGEGTMTSDGRSLDFKAPCLLIVPTAVVHGFAFSTDSSGAVLTVSDSYLDNLVRREPQLGGVLARLTVLREATSEALADAFERLRQELAWTAPGHGVAVEALLLMILVEALRLSHHATAAPTQVGRRAALVARFREQVEARFRSQATIDAYAEVLNVSSKQLRAACVSVAGAPPARIIQDRVLLEAKRLLLYSNSSVAEAAFELGFDDPTYFTRFFTRRSGVSPRQFRKQGGEVH